MGRVYLNEDNELVLGDGDYGQHQNGSWYCKAPGNHMGNLTSHDVIEHEDGTITVSPSILITTTGREGKKIELYHGYLKKGVWSS